ncbi:MAG: amidohydrolase family protein [Planctomycetes bacterium]|nr:amidohydrolase family protein [Planctomycetota bacterium]
MEYPEGCPIVNVHSHYHTYETIDEVKKRAQAYGIRYYVMSALRGIEGRRGNDVLKDEIARHPDFIIGLYHLDVDAEPVDVIYKAVQEGFRGIKIIGTLQPYDSPDYYPFYETIEKEGLPVLFHTGFLSISPEQRGKTVSMMNMRPGMLDTLGRAFPDMKMIAAHMGAPWFLEAVATAYFHDNVYLDLSGGIVRTMSMQFFRRLFSFRDAGSPDVKELPFPIPEDTPGMKVLGKTMFGTDNPPPERLVEFTRNMLDGMGADRDTKDKVWYRNAGDIFGLDLP